MADQIPEERQWALILVAGGDEAYNRWDTLEETVQDRKKVEQVWKAFEKSFEKSTSFWHFRDTYLADFRQDESETTANLDLRIKQTVRGCQWQKESEEERNEPMSVTSLSTKTIKLPTGEQTARLPTIIHCYLLTHCLKDGPVAAVIMANVVANVASLMSRAIVLRMGKLAIGAKASIISKLSVVPR